MRPDWDSYFLKIAYAVSERSTCDRAFVGCVLVREKRILTTGFNGSPAGQDHCDEIGHLMVDGHCVRTIHAETNAIIQAALHGVSTKGATCYVTHLPCINCTKALINAGVIRIVYSVAYRTDENAVNFLKAANIEFAITYPRPSFALLKRVGIPAFKGLNPGSFQRQMERLYDRVTAGALAAAFADTAAPGEAGEKE